MEIKIEDNKIFVEKDFSELREKFFGTVKDNRLYLTVEECLYLNEMRNFEVKKDGKLLSFIDIIREFGGEKTFIRYNTYREWRDRGLFLKRFELKNFGNVTKVSYPSKSLNFEKFKNLKIYFSPSDLISFVCEPEKFFKIFEDYWIGQYGVYKQHKKGKTFKLDIFETIFCKKFLLAKIFNIENNEEISEEEIFEFTKNKEVFKAIYEVYEDWRLRGFVVKTGYKFGSHFRIYFPGVSPTKSPKEWIHSQHVLHVFPKFERMLISEWSRAIRVAHSVRKTFIIGVPGMKESDYLDIELDFLAFHRDEKNRVLTPNNKPSYILWCLGEDEYIGGAELGSALEIAESCGLDLLLAINGRESDVTYYLAKQIDLPESRFKYYEIRWFQP
ncbi:MAG: tRNA-intron lyase [Candidatus Aenigmarchaeota archaeon]|nr:tRNA-intron lyase [Candidatus Aenigmarchaeota archaeon]MDW8149783.1 tRNA-intron lyase [Candidatus Aenigmarchaeota archaeon]